MTKWSGSRADLQEQTPASLLTYTILSTMEDNELFNSTPFPASVKAIREDKQIMMRSSSVGNNMTDILKTNEKKRNIVFNASKVEVSELM